VNALSDFLTSSKIRHRAIRLPMDHSARKKTGFADPMRDRAKPVIV